MATAQQQQFASTYGPYAAQAGTALGVNPNVILGQWAFESAFGTSRAAVQQGNLAGINLPGSTTGTNYATYASPADFEAAYVQTLQNPRYAAALNTGGDVSAFVGGLKQGGYFTADQGQYTAGVQADVTALGGAGAAGTAAPVPGFDPANPELGPYSTAPGAMAPVPGGLSTGWIADIWDLMKRMAVIGVGAGILLLALAALLWQSKTVKVAIKGAGA